MPVFLSSHPHPSETLLFKVRDASFVNCNYYTKAIADLHDEVSRYRCLLSESFVDIDNSLN